MSLKQRVIFAPFTSGEQLVSDLDHKPGIGGDGAGPASEPGTKSGPSTTTTSTGPRLPGHPRVRLSDTDGLWRFLQRDLGLGDLEEMAPRLWMMSTHSRSNISALHRQRVKGRTIVVAEDHRLHLVWYYDRIFIKPLPRYLLSAAFWEEYLCPPPASVTQTNTTGTSKQQQPPLSRQQQLEEDQRHEKEEQRRSAIRQAASGLLRSYAYLILHESDFRLALHPDLGLIPPGTTWSALSDLLTLAAAIPDAAVSHRYQYGEIRLSRLNFYAKFFLRKLAFQRVHGQYGAYFAQYYGPLLFVFAIASVLLAALQVELQAEPLFEDTAQWPVMARVGRWFSVVALVATAGLAVWLVGLLVFKVCKEWVHALAGRRRWRREQGAGSFAHKGTQTDV